MPSLDELNNLSDPEALDGFMKCCGSTSWANAMLKARPFPSLNMLLSKASEIWSRLGEDDYREAFRHHPRIGEDLSVLRQKFSNTAAWAGEEQRGMAGVSDEVLKKLQDGNRKYESKFNHVFLICATGKSAEEMLRALDSRIVNDSGKELQIAAEEQGKITKLRLQKWINT